MQGSHAYQRAELGRDELESTADRRGRHERRGSRRPRWLQLLWFEHAEQFRQLGLGHAAVLRRRLRHGPRQQHHQAFKAGGPSHEAAIKKFLDFAYQDKWQLQFDNEYDLLPATQSAATSMGQSNATFAAFLGNITNSVNYPAQANWTSVENMIKTQVGQAITGNPAQVLGAIQQTATSTAG